MEFVPHDVEEDPGVRSAVALGIQKLAGAAKAALSRQRGGIRTSDALWSAQEREAVAAVIFFARLTGDRLGRSQFRRVESFAEEFTPVLAERALSYFRGLTPVPGGDPARDESMRRQAFTLAVDADAVTLSRVKAAIDRRIATGADYDTAASDVEGILTEAGVSPINPQYSEMVFRTNVADAFNAGATEEMTDPAVRDFFPVWQYLGIDDKRAGDDHRPRFGRYYPNTVTFGEVRGERVFNCRCTFRPIDKYLWEELEAQGKRVEQWPT